MKMFKLVTHSLFMFVSLWIFLLMMSTTGCGEGADNEWVGTWTVLTIDGESVEQNFEQEVGESTAATWEWRFDNDGMFEFELKAKNFDLSEEGSIILSGTYSISDFNYTMLPMKMVGTGDAAEFSEDFDSSDQITGTWSRKGNTLTINYDNYDDGTLLSGIVFVLRKS